MLNKDLMSRKSTKLGVGTVLELRHTIERIREYLTLIDCLCGLENLSDTEVDEMVSVFLEMHVCNEWVADYLKRVLYGAFKKSADTVVQCPDPDRTDKVRDAVDDTVNKEILILGEATPVDEQKSKVRTFSELWDVLLGFEQFLISKGETYNLKELKPAQTKELIDEYTDKYNVGKVLLKGLTDVFAKTMCRMYNESYYEMNLPHLVHCSLISEIKVYCII